MKKIDWNTGSTANTLIRTFIFTIVVLGLIFLASKVFS